MTDEQITDFSATARQLRNIASWSHTKELMGTIVVVNIAQGAKAIETLQAALSACQKRNVELMDKIGEKR